MQHHLSHPECGNDSSSKPRAPCSAPDNPTRNFCGGGRKVSGAEIEEGRRKAGVAADLSESFGPWVSHYCRKAGPMVYYFATLPLLDQPKKATEPTRCVQRTEHNTPLRRPQYYRCWWNIVLRGIISRTMFAGCDVPSSHPSPSLLQLTPLFCLPGDASEKRIAIDKSLLLSRG